MTSRTVITICTVLLILIAACAPQGVLDAQPLNLTPPKTACDEMNCGTNAYCEAGVCMCDGGFKKCGSSCIAQNLCCSDDQCPSGKECTKGLCVDRPVCKFNEEWDDRRKECSCAEGAKFCSVQGKCIPADSCCAHIDCADDERCADTTYSTTTCIKLFTKKCRTVHEGLTIEFLMQGGDFDVKLQNVLEGPKFDLQVNNDSVRRVRTNETNIVGGNASIYVESMTVYGGTCKEDVED